MTGVLLMVAGTASAPASAISGGTPAAEGEYGFVAQIKVGTFVRACTGALVDPEWVATVSGCFAEAGGPVAPGAPATPTTVTVGRADFATGSGGETRTVTQLVPHETRNVVLAKLSAPVIGVTPIPVATTAPAAGESLRVAGFGRTAATWAPDRLHTTLLGVQQVGASTVDLVGAAGAGVICKGDAGGPTFRTTAAGGVELIGLHTSSTQSGCIGVPASADPALAVDTRVDDLAGWVRQTVHGSTFVRLPTSASVLDTRTGLGGVTGARPANSVTRFPVAGVGGVPATGVTAVLIDVTAVTSTAGLHLTVQPDGQTVNTNLSMLNAGPNQTISNTAVVNVPSNGRLQIATSGGGVHLVADVQGYFTRTAAGGGFVRVGPTRIVDTRSGLGGHTGTVPTGGSRTFDLTGGPIPEGAATAFVDLIATDATRPGWIGAYPAGGANRSVMDYVPGSTAHAVSVRLGADGRATFTNNSGSPINIIMTAAGYWTGSPATGSGLRTVTASRKLNSRNPAGAAPLAANAVRDIPLGLPPGTTALVNLTITGNTETGYLRVWPLGTSEPIVSWVNYPVPPAPARAGMTAVRVGTDGKIRLKNVSTGTVHVLVDLQGWYGPA